MDPNSGASRLILTHDLYEARLLLIVKRDIFVCATSATNNSLNSIIRAQYTAVFSRAEFFDKSGSYHNFRTEFADSALILADDKTSNSTHNVLLCSELIFCLDLNIVLINERKCRSRDICVRIIHKINLVPQT